MGEGVTPILEGGSKLPSNWPQLLAPFNPNGFHVQARLYSIASLFLHIKSVYLYHIYFLRWFKRKLTTVYIKISQKCKIWSIVLKWFLYPDIANIDHLVDSFFLVCWSFWFCFWTSDTLVQIFYCRPNTHTKYSSEYPPRVLYYTDYYETRVVNPYWTGRIYMSIPG